MKVMEKNIVATCICGTSLELCADNYPFSEAYYICPSCDSTFNITDFL